MGISRANYDRQHVKGLANELKDKLAASGEQLEVSVTLNMPDTIDAAAHSLYCMPQSTMMGSEETNDVAFREKRYIFLLYLLFEMFDIF